MDIQSEYSVLLSMRLRKYGLGCNQGMVHG